MDKSQLFVEERKIKIVEFVERHRKATVAQLCDHFCVSSATIRNDLRDLEENRLIIRTHGGAMVRSKTGLELSAAQKEVQNLEAKRAIARTACALIEDGDTIVLDTGTTTLELARLLTQKRDLTVVTNDLPIALALEEMEGVSVVFMGGLLRKRFHCTVAVGEPGDRALSGLTVDKAFMGANGFSVERGATTPDIHTAQTKKMMIAIAAAVILLCDSSKHGRNSFAQFATLGEITMLVTERCDQRVREQLEAEGVEVVCG